MNQSAYKWELRFADGNVKTKGAGEKAEFDFQNPPEYFGKPTMITMVSMARDFKNIKIRIPKGALPVCHRRPTCANGIQLTGLSYRVGWNMFGMRHMISVDAKTGDIELISDDRGRTSKHGKPK